MKRQSLFLSHTRKLKPFSGCEPDCRTVKAGFTIVELIVVIVVIGILAAITIVGYTGISGKATASTIQSDLSNNAQLLKVYNTSYGAFPTTLDGNKCPSAPTADAKYCLKASGGNTLTYTNINGVTFHLTETNGNTSYSINDSSQPALTKTSYGSAVGSACLFGFIPVPGSGTYGTNDFCVMKYNAKADDNGDGTGDTNRTTGSNTWPASTYPISGSRKLVSTAAGYPVAVISQTTAITAAQNFTANCPSGCHLLTEAEYMTIAQNVLSVPSNWSTGIVGSGYIYSGHNDNAPAKALQATTNDSNGYYGETNTGGNQRRTLTLTNGEVIWDMSGNVQQWTSGTTTGNQPGIAGEVTWGWREYTAVNANGSLNVNPLPSGTGLTGANTWNSGQGVGQLNSNTSNASLCRFLRGGSWVAGGLGGVLSLAFFDSSLDFVVVASVGFRVSW